jgi:hypothetical protein
MFGKHEVDHKGDYGRDLKRELVDRERMSLAGAQ